MTTGPLEDIVRLRDRIDRRLAELLPVCIAGQDGLREAIASAVLAPGKRLRPLMSVATALDLSGNIEAAVDGGCAIEMVHAASLILDDLPSMDDAALRRGRPATHVAFGEDVAQLAVIAILARAFEVLAVTGSLDPAERTRNLSALTQAVGASGLVGGQFADLRGGRSERSADDIARANALKTGSLFLAAVEIGTAGSGASETVRAGLADFARELGHAFQLLDDLLDGGTSAAAIGKDVGKDAGKSTIVAMLGRESTEAQIERHMRAASKHLDAALGPGSRLSYLLAMIRERARLPAAGEQTAGDEDRVTDKAGMQ